MMLSRNASAMRARYLLLLCTGRLPAILIDTNERADICSIEKRGSLEWIISAIVMGLFLAHQVNECQNYDAKISSTHKWRYK